MPKSDWWFKFEHLKWLTDEQLSRCSLETQGFWIRCICLMRKSGSGMIEGTGPELLRLLSVSGAELKRCTSELISTKAADVTLCHASVTQKSASFRIVSRKIQRELKTKEQNRLRKQRERRHANVTPLSRDRVKSKEKEVREEKKEQPPLKEIFLGTVLSGVAQNLGLKKLSLPTKREWTHAADLAFENGFTAAEFMACHADLCEKHTYTILPQYVTDRLPAFLKARRKVVTLPTPEENRQEDAEQRALGLRPAPVRSP